MKRFMYCSVWTILLALTGAQPVAAQGWGAFLDWINELSGPRMIGPTVSWWTPLADESPVNLRLSATWRTSTFDDDKVSLTDSVIGMWSFQPTLEFKPADALAFGGGVGLHRFGGDADGFTHITLPLYGQLRFPNSGKVQGVVTVGTQYFLEFDATDFAPLDPTVSRNGGEWTAWVQVGFEIVR